jgi:hypothetical protein
MTDLQFTGTFYLGGGLLCKKPGRYTTNDQFAQFLVAAYPREFALAEPEAAQNEPETAQTTKSEPNIEQTLNDSPATQKTMELPKKANREQLEAKAKEIGLVVTPEMDTNAKLRQAIEQNLATE